MSVTVNPELIARVLGGKTKSPFVMRGKSLMMQWNSMKISNDEHGFASVELLLDGMVVGCIKSSTPVRPGDTLHIDRIKGSTEVTLSN